MLGVNKVVLIGNACKDPEIIRLNSDVGFSFSLATTEPRSPGYTSRETALIC